MQRNKHIANIERFRNNRNEALIQKACASDQRTSNCQFKLTTERFSDLNKSNVSNLQNEINAYSLCWLWKKTPQGYLLSTFNRQLWKDIFLQPTDHDSCFHQIMQLLVIASTLIQPEKTLQSHVVISHNWQQKMKKAIW